MELELQGRLIADHPHDGVDMAECDLCVTSEAEINATADRVARFVIAQSEALAIELDRIFVRWYSGNFSPGAGDGHLPSNSSSRLETPPPEDSHG